ncbi:hypothetical protein KI809_19400 [Geobacter pelophilus]|jgi:hypothetical protein|uniref:Uncharacterized protein n=2 Tax=Geoanaerobacter pelophilus TaxID=60036 RepID=A0AAW4L9F1_9BACT|nr:hypothetical protein [Geoanaerobacter pelophilus]MBT0666480.1 hypothetical protein [Geoanaerobacter pelophilus]
MATGVANRMKAHFGEAIDLEIHLIDSADAANYVLRGATTVFLDGTWVPLDIATSAGRMQEYIEQAIIDWTH